MGMLSGRKFFANEAKELGIVQRVFAKDQLLVEAVRYATDMAINVPPASLATIKRQLLVHPHLDHNTALQQSNHLMLLSLSEAPFKEGVASYVEKRVPKFGAADWKGKLLTTMDRLLAKL